MFPRCVSFLWESGIPRADERCCARGEEGEWNEPARGKGEGAGRRGGGYGVGREQERRKDQTGRIHGSPLTRIDRSAQDSTRARACARSTSPADFSPFSVDDRSGPFSPSVNFASTRRGPLGFDLLRPSSACFVPLIPCFVVNLRNDLRARACRSAATLDVFWIYVHMYQHRFENSRESSHVDRENVSVISCEIFPFERKLFVLQLPLDECSYGINMYTDVGCIFNVNSRSGWLIIM